MLGKKAGGPSGPRPEASCQVRRTKHPSIACTWIRLLVDRPLGRTPRPNTTPGGWERDGAGKGACGPTDHGLEASGQVRRVEHPSGRRVQTDPGEAPRLDPLRGLGSPRPARVSGSLLSLLSEGGAGGSPCAPLLRRPTLRPGPGPGRPRALPALESAAARRAAPASPARGARPRPGLTESGAAAATAVAAARAAE